MEGEGELGKGWTTGGDDWADETASAEVCVCACVCEGVSVRVCVCAF